MTDTQLSPAQIREPYHVETYRWTEPVQDRLEAVDERLRLPPEGEHEWLGMATAHLVRAGGKRIRPTVSLLACGVFDVDRERAVSLAAGVEMLHTATLVHDDLIDHADTRRGAPTINAVSGGEAAILVGDYLFARAANLVAETDSVRVMSEFAHTLMVILNGEVEQHFSRWSADRSAYSKRIYAKTAALFVLASQAPAILGQAPEEQRLALAEYGRAAGTAFQIVDDVLDYTAETARLGKPAGGDLRQGIITLPLIHYAETHPQDEDLRAVMAGRGAAHASIVRLIEKVRSSDSIDAALAEARAQLATAHQAIAALPPSVYTRALHELTDTVVERMI